MVEKCYWIQFLEFSSLTLSMSSGQSCRVQGSLNQGLEYIEWPSRTLRKPLHTLEHCSVVLQALQTLVRLPLGLGRPTASCRPECQRSRKREGRTISSKVLAFVITTIETGLSTMSWLLCVIRTPETDEHLVLNIVK